MKQLFHIENKNSRPGEKILSLRLGERHVSFAITDKSGSVCHQLAYCSIEQCNEQELTEFRRSYPSLDSGFAEVLIAYDNIESRLVPSWFHSRVDPVMLMRAMATDLYGAHVISEMVNGWDLYNVYSMSKEVQDWMTQQFPSGSYRHQFTVGLVAMKREPLDRLVVDLRTDNFTVLAVKNGDLILARTFSYSTPEDVVYYLLKICTHFLLSQQDIQLELSGLVDQRSSLFNDLNQYFINVQFREASWQQAGNDYPAHFFTSLNDLARCAS